MMLGGVNQRFNFALEDTGDKCYRDVRDGLLRRGWRKVAHRRRTKLERKRLPMKEVPLLIWTLNDKDIEYSTLHPFQVCNHFEGIAQLTTKRGFTELLKDSMQWICQDQYDIAPRCYNLGDPLHREEFVEDFRVTALTNILQWTFQTLKHSDCDSNTGIVGGQIIGESGTRLLVKKLEKWIILMRTYLRVNVGGEWPGVETNGFDCDEQESADGIAIQTSSRILGATERDWTEILEFSYTLVESQQMEVYMRSNRGSANARECGTCPDNLCSTCLDHHIKSILTKKTTDDVLELQLALILKALAQLVSSRQYTLNGSSNVWVVKAPEASCGTGLKLLHRLTDILECERGFGGRTVQKYVEMSLLAPRVDGMVHPLHQDVITARFGPATAKYGLKASGANTGRVPDTKYMRNFNGRDKNANDNTYETSQNSSRDKTSQRFTVEGSRKHHDSTDKASPRRVKWHKFDVRVWVLVTSLQPLRAHVFSRVYGRQCGTAVNTGLQGCRTDSLQDHLMHLTNYSVQKKVSTGSASVTPTMSSSTHGSNTGIGSATLQSSGTVANRSMKGHMGVMRKLHQEHVSPTENQVDSLHMAALLASPSEKDHAGTNAPAGGSANAYQEALLLSHEDILSIVNAHDIESDEAKSDLEGAGRTRGSRWEREVWPKLCRKIVATLEATRCHPSVNHRPLSFELLGFDVLFDRNYEPWILEVNMSPAMAHRGTNQSQNIASMAEGLLDLAVLPYTDPERNPELFKGRMNYPVVPADHPPPTITTATGTTYDISAPEPDIFANEFITRVESAMSNNHHNHTGESVHVETPPSATDLKESNASSSPPAPSVRGHWEMLELGSVKTTPTPAPDPLSHLARQAKYQVAPTAVIGMRPSQRSSWKVVNRHGYTSLSHRDALIGQASSGDQGADTTPGGELSPPSRFMSPADKKAVITHRAVMPHLRSENKVVCPPNCAQGGPVPPTRPRSGQAARRPSSAYSATSGGNNARSGVYGVEDDLDEHGLDIACSLRGRAITEYGVLHIDDIVTKFERILLLQRWTRRYLQRAREWHLRRHQAALVAQRTVRQFLLACDRWHRRRYDASILMQSGMRRKLATNEAQRRRRNNAALQIQCCQRRRQASHCVSTRRRNKRATDLQAWARGIAVRWRLVMASMLVMCVRRWYRHRRRMKKRLFRAISTHHYAQERRRQLAEKYILRWLYRKRARLGLLKLRCKRIGDLAAAAGRSRLLRLLEEKQMEERREQANWQYVADLIATETLLSEPTSLSLVWAIAESALRACEFEAQIEKRMDQERKEAVEEEENHRKEIIQQVDRDMRRKIMSQVGLSEQTRHLLCDARGLLQASDFKQFQEQLHQRRKDAEMNDPRVRRLQSGEALEEVNAMFGDFEEEQQRKREYAAAGIAVPRVVKEVGKMNEHRDSVLFNGRLIYAPTDTVTATAGRRARAAKASELATKSSELTSDDPYTTLSGSDTGVHEPDYPPETEATEQQLDSEKGHENAPEGHYFHEDDETSRQKREEILRENMRRKAEAGRELLRRRKEQQQRHVERTQRAMELRLEKEKEKTLDPAAIAKRSSHRKVSKVKNMDEERTAKKASSVYSAGVPIHKVTSKAAWGQSKKGHSESSVSRQPQPRRKSRRGDVDSNAVGETKESSVTSEGSWSGAPLGRLGTIVGSSDGSNDHSEAGHESREEGFASDVDIDARSSVFGGSAGSVADDGASSQSGARVPHDRNKGDKNSNIESCRQHSSSTLKNLVHFSDAIIHEENPGFTPLVEGSLQSFNTDTDTDSTAIPEKFTLASSARGGAGSRASQVARSRSPLRKKKGSDTTRTTREGSLLKANSHVKKGVTFDVEGDGRNASESVPISRRGKHGGKVSNKAMTVGKEEVVHHGSRVGERSVNVSWGANLTGDSGADLLEDVDYDSEDQQAARRLASAWHDQQQQCLETAQQLRRRAPRPPRPQSAAAPMPSSASLTPATFHEPPLDVFGRDFEGMEKGADSRGMFGEMDSYAYIHEDLPSSHASATSWDAFAFNTFTQPNSSGTKRHQSSNTRNTRKQTKGRVTTSTTSSRYRPPESKLREGDYTLATNNLLTSMLNGLSHHY